MGKIKVSVIIPFRNRKKISNMLKSMWKNTNEKNWEMILVFGDYILPEGVGRGQPDELLYRELIEIFKENPNVRLLKTSDSKYKFDLKIKEFRKAAAINWGVQNAVGEYIFFTSDDYYHTPSWLETMLKLSEQFDMSKTIINPVNLEGFILCDKNTDIKEKLWSTIKVNLTGRRYYFREFPLELGVSDLELNKYWEKTKMDSFDVEKNCTGPAGSTAPFLMRRDLWISMGGRQLTDANFDSETEFHHRLKNMGITKIIPRNVYIFNLDIPNKFINI